MACHFDLYGQAQIQAVNLDKMLHLCFLSLFSQIKKPSDVDVVLRY